MFFLKSIPMIGFCIGLIATSVNPILATEVESEPTVLDLTSLDLFLREIILSGGQDTFLQDKLSIEVPNQKVMQIPPTTIEANNVPDNVPGGGVFLFEENLAVDDFSKETDQKTDQKEVTSAPPNDGLPLDQERAMTEFLRRLLYLFRVLDNENQQQL